MAGRSAGIGRLTGAGSDARSGPGFVSAVAVSITDAIESFDLAEFGIDRLELLAQALDVAVDRAVIDVDMLAIGRVHQLIAIFDVTRTLRQRFEDQELGHRQLDGFAVPGTLMARRIERHRTAYDDRLALAVLALARQFAAPEQGADALDQEPLRERLADIIVGPHPQAEQFIDLVILRGQENDREVAVPPQLAQKLHAVHPRHLDVEDGDIDRLRRHALQRLGPVAEAAHRETLGLERHRHRGQDVPVVIDKGNRICHGCIPQDPLRRANCRRSGRFDTEIWRRGGKYKRGRRSYSWARACAISAQFGRDWACESLSGALMTSYFLQVSRNCGAVGLFGHG